MWENLLEKYRDSDTNQLVFVKYLGGSKAQVELYVKEEGSWKLLMSGEGEVGKDGIGKCREGDRKTPVGEYTLTGGFGILENPGTKIPYVKVHEYLYLCGDEEYYNQLIDIREHPHKCTGEHLIEYTQCYAWGMFLDYNKENIFGEGSAIFLHCKGNKGYTEGCVAVDPSFMKTILCHAEKNAKICIYRIG